MNPVPLARGWIGHIRQPAIGVTLANTSTALSGRWEGVVPKGIAGMKDYVGGGPAGTAEWTGLEFELPSRVRGQTQTPTDTARTILERRSQQPGIARADSPWIQHDRFNPTLDNVSWRMRKWRWNRPRDTMCVNSTVMDSTIDSWFGPRMLRSM